MVLGRQKNSLVGFRLAALCGSGNTPSAILRFDTRLICDLIRNQIKFIGGVCSGIVVSFEQRMWEWEGEREMPYMIVLLTCATKQLM